jgi:hypothetical protein
MQFLLVHLHVETEETFNRDSNLSAGWVSNQLALKYKHWLLNRVRSNAVTILRSDVPTALLMKIQIFVDVTCSLINIYLRFGTAYYLQNISNYSHTHTASCFRGLKSSFSSSKIHCNLSYLFRSRLFSLPVSQRNLIFPYLFFSSSIFSPFLPLLYFLRNSLFCFLYLFLTRISFCLSVLHEVTRLLK